MFTKRLNEIKERKLEIRSLLEKDQNANLEELGKELETLETEERSIDERIKMAERINSGSSNEFRHLETPGNEDEKRKINKYATMEYRKVFMSFCQTGNLASEYRSDEFASTADVGAIIPETIMNEVIKKLTSYGQIYNRVRKINIKGGVNVPILSLKPTATWIDENGVSDRKKASVNSKVQFSYFGLECRIATSLLAQVTSLNMFESLITELIVEAMIVAMDKAIISGAGTTQPLGIVNDTRIPASNKITLSPDNFVKWDGWKKKVFAKIPLAYRAGGSFIMAAGTFEGYIDGMTDANGQPIGRINYGITSGPQERFGGREVILVEDDVIKPYESANTGDVVAIFCKLSDYCINSNMEMTMYRWFDHDTNQWVDKAILIADGKILDPNGVIIIKKGA